MTIRKSENFTNCCILEENHEIQHFKLWLSIFSMYALLEWCNGLENGERGNACPDATKEDVISLTACCLLSGALLLPESVPLILTPKEFFANGAEEIFILELDEVDFEIGPFNDHFGGVVNLPES